METDCVAKTNEFVLALGFTFAKGFGGEGEFAYANDKFAFILKAEEETADFRET